MNTVAFRKQLAAARDKATVSYFVLLEEIKTASPKHYKMLEEVARTHGASLIAVLREYGDPRTWNP